MTAGSGEASSWGGARKRVFILGSCVSRDALEAFPDSFELAGYLARTSMASIGMPRIDDAEVRDSVAKIPSSFQRRMLCNDLDKTTLSIVTDTPHDAIVVDMIDERFDLVLTEASFFSYSGELQRSGFNVSNRRTLGPDNDAFVSLWLAGFQRLLASVERDKVVLNRALWAEKFPDNSDVASPGWIKRNNAILERLYDEIDRRWCIPAIAYPQDLVIADRDHRWGIAPYHYIPPFYECAMNQLEFLLRKE